MYSANVKRGALVLALTLVAVSITTAPGIAATESFLLPQGPIAAGQKAHLIRVTAITMIAILPVLVLLPIILIRYRRKNAKAAYRPNWDFTLGLEILMWGVPFAIITVLSIQLWQSTFKLDPYAPLKSELPTIDVQVIGLDWKWLFVYPDYDIATVGELAIPTGHPISMDLTTDTVMQSFWIASLAGQIYAMPGMVTELNFIADVPGRMQGENTQYSGTGFSQQKFATVSMPRSEFDGWVAKVRETGIALDGDAYEVLARRSTRSEAHKALATAAMPADVIYFTLSDARLFQKVVGRYHSGTPIPAQDQPGTSIYDQSLATDGDTSQ
jgi:cytochrome o ubiquinol oxidase subunit 2